MNKERVKEVLAMIASDMAEDAKNFEGQPFTGQTVARGFGNHGAAIAALADIINALLDEIETKQKPAVPNAT